MRLLAIPQPMLGLHGNTQPTINPPRVPISKGGCRGLRPPPRNGSTPNACDKPTISPADGVLAIRMLGIQANARLHRNQKTTISHTAPSGSSEDRAIAMSGLALGMTLNEHVTERISPTHEKHA